MARPDVRELVAWSIAIALKGADTRGRVDATWKSGNTWP
ncbi:hypothetical protein OP10G_3937 [Fimbriimonas ginsengisoli Gsoil 348]|uniref:Uncharacterized protein n=1 Tax=Fimbriimonas ginsengisoli Gsoil 348 TaxID=661478 RepID=A0A068NWZ6_FIMGI|nr:hypothetical protein OP10G_3937 [Fimbriimonas ginsengisoli Gsoil 348]